MFEDAVAPGDGSTPRAPGAVRQYFESLANSPVLKGLTEDPNGGHHLSILEQAKRLPPKERPDPPHVVILAAGLVNAHESAAIVSRDYNQFNERWIAEMSARAAQEYFFAIGDTARAQVFTEAMARLKEGMERYQRDRATTR